MSRDRARELFCDIYKFYDVGNEESTKYIHDCTNIWKLAKMTIEYLEERDADQ